MFVRSSMEDYLWVMLSKNPLHKISVLNWTKHRNSIYFWKSGDKLEFCMDKCPEGPDDCEWEKDRIESVGTGYCSDYEPPAEDAGVQDAGMSDAGMSDAGDGGK